MIKCSTHLHRHSLHAHWPRLIHRHSRSARTLWTAMHRAIATAYASVARLRTTHVLIPHVVLHAALIVAVIRTLVHRHSRTARLVREERRSVRSVRSLRSIDQRRSHVGSTVVRHAHRIVAERGSHVIWSVVHITVVHVVVRMTRIILARLHFEMI